MSNRVNHKKIYLTSDTHFGHRNILDYCDRPFESVEEHDEALINNWNEVVEPNTSVYHLGDFAFAKEERIFEILDQLNGHIHLIWGNHDGKIKNSPELIERFASTQNYLEISTKDEEIGHRQYIVMSHYPFESWNKKHYRSWHVHGHCHGTSQKVGCRIDVGVDTNDFRPVSYQQLKTAITKNYMKSQLTNNKGK